MNGVNEMEPVLTTQSLTQPAVPASPVAPAPPSTADFREAMAHLPAAVNILTTDGPRGRCGITVSAACSVTDSPPTVLVCVNQRSATHDVFNGNGRVCLNVLAAEDEWLARHFSGMTDVSMAERFTWDIWDQSAPVPLLRDALVNIVGVIADRKSMGSHSVLFVTIEQVRARTDRDSLVYFNRRFHRLEADPAGAGGDRK
ncbi:flavin reductase (NADH) [Prauserella marina]|uniref:Flavin reductase (NADH) n=1 Tax=Prauserella marina TaxID=530584 RepID=A0A1G6KHV7_9PSEU|nr:4-hydroxyphenylacetate 3-monooxygenase reductase component [Prauserella marina]SDC30563.1 flavin reductase (NADH) [Prauserella marina]